MEWSVPIFKNRLAYANVGHGGDGSLIYIPNTSANLTNLTKPYKINPSYDQSLNT